MANEVTIEGSQVMPSDRLGRGVRAKVELTDDIKRLIRNGSVILVDQDVPSDLRAKPEPVQVEAPQLPEQTWSPGDSPILPEVPESAYGPDATPLNPVQPAEPKPPPKNGATSDWQKWVADNVPGADTEGKSRDELIAVWQDHGGE